MTLLTGPPGSGRTTEALELARRVCAAGGRVWWVGLPSQRSAVYRRATADAAAIVGLEFLTAQQVYYRLLARARRLKPLITGSARLVLVGEALAADAGAVPSPGEARLFAYAIAEAKRFGVRPDAAVLDQGDAERARFQRVYASYVAATQEVWDYDDFRTNALELVEERPDLCEAEMVVVDGFRELGPKELRLFRALAAAKEVVVTLPEAPEGVFFEQEQALPPRASSSVQRYRAANPVAEARWVLRAVKRDLADGGFDPLDLAIIAPPGRARAVAALAEEYGLPVMDETPVSLAESEAGRALVELLDLADYPTPSRLLAVPELAPLANVALAAGVAGADAIGLLADRHGMGERWRSWLATLEVADPPLPWARALVREVLPAVLDVPRRRRARGDEPPALGQVAGMTAETDRAAASLTSEPTRPRLPDGFVEQVLQKAQEAARLAQGPSFRVWWSALLRQPRPPQPGRGGVTLTGATQVSGRRFRRVYLLGATEGAYGAAEAEDYFVPEEDRASLAESNLRLGLPPRFQGRDAGLAEELLSRGDEVVVTFPEADQGGPRTPDLALTAEARTPLPVIAAGSPLELAGDRRYLPSWEAVALREPSVERLRRYSACAFRAWGEAALAADAERPWWLELIGRLRAQLELSDERLAELAAAFPDAAEWLRQQAPLLQSLRFGVRLAGTDDGPVATVDAAGRAGSHAVLYRFTAPGRVHDRAEADAYIGDRWTELWSAGHLLKRYRGRIKRVDVSVWPLLGEPIAVYPDGITYAWRRVENRLRDAEQAFGRFQAGDITPSPGFICRDCPVFDVCRVGVRT